jgi:flagellin-like protein
MEFSNVNINFSDEKGVSPVIGVILMVAVTVALVALVTVVVFDLGGDVSESPDATVQLEADSGKVVATNLRNENVESFKLQAPDGTTGSISGSVGSSATLANGAGEYAVIAVMPDGSEEVLTSKDFSNVNSVITGTVSYNPPAEGVTVELVDGGGNVLDTDVTDSDGSYSLSGSGSNLNISINGNEFSSNNNKIDINLISNNVASSQSDIPAELMNGSGTSADPYEVETASDLQSIKYDLDAHYKVVNNIDASHTSNWNNGKGFEPIGESPNSFASKLNGQNYIIDGITIDRGSEGYVGVFGAVNSNGVLKNIALTNVDINGGGPSVGGLVGENSGDISSSYSTGSVDGDNRVGGLVGQSDGDISNSYSKSSVNGDGRTGGLVGNNLGDISSSYSTGSVSAMFIKGGLVGGNSGSITDSYWNTVSSGQPTSNGGTGLTTSEMQGSSASSNMNGFDFTNVWKTASGKYPKLK